MSILITHNVSKLMAMLKRNCSKWPMDEKPYQLLGEVRDSWVTRPGNNKKVYLEYLCLRRDIWRSSPHVRQRTQNCSEKIKYMVDEMYPKAEKTFLVIDS